MVPLPDPAAEVNVSQGWSDDAFQAHPAGVVILMVPVAPPEGADAAAAGLTEIAHGPVAVESTASIRFRTSPKSPRPRILSRPVNAIALCPIVTVSGPNAVRWSGGSDAGSGRSPAFVCRITPRLGAEPGSHCASPVFTSVGVAWQIAPEGTTRVDPFSTVTSRLGHTTWMPAISALANLRGPEPAYGALPTWMRDMVDVSVPVPRSARMTVRPACRVWT